MTRCSTCASGEDMESRVDPTQCIIPSYRNVDGGGIVGFLRLPVYALIPVLLAVVACDRSTSTPPPTADIEATVQAAVIDALPTSTLAPAPDVEATVTAAVRATVTALPALTLTSTPVPTPFTPAPDVEATVIAAVRATVTSLPSPTPTIKPNSTPVPTLTMTPDPTATQTPNSQFAAVCASGERLVRLHELGEIPADLIDELEAISKACGFSWCNPRYCH